MKRRKLITEWMRLVQKRSNDLEPQDLKAEIDALKGELDRLIALGASFNEIYSISVKLDRLIVIFYRNKLAESVVKEH